MASVNFTQSINSFIRPLGVRLSSPEQILAKVTMIAIAAMFIADSLPSRVAAYDCTWFDACTDNCRYAANFNRCIFACLKSCCAKSGCGQACEVNCSKLST